VITSLEFDHADIYRDVDHIKAVFRELVSRMPEDGIIFAAADHEHVADVVRDAPCEVVHYGADRHRQESGAKWRAANVDVGPHGTSFDLTPGESHVVTCSILQAGVFNAENAVAALAVANYLEIPLVEASVALARFQGVKRRLEVRGVAAERVIVDDFAHHPTAVRETVLASRYYFPGRRIVAVFEPRSNTSRRGIFQRQYGKSFDQAASIVVRQPADDPIYSAIGAVDERDRFDAGRLVRELQNKHKRAIAMQDVDEIVAFLVEETEPGDVILVMSNGGFDGIFDRLTAAFGGFDEGGLDALVEKEAIELEARAAKIEAEQDEPDFL
jgi:UDP-N-acetylmuramate: L-alanyl-gamma-D-glutamyl-meso-diaminopimelate ligase